MNHLLKRSLLLIKVSKTLSLIRKDTHQEASTGCYFLIPAAQTRIVSLLAQVSAH
ncbi:hypothetical protein KIN20_023761 [Parelaphostrongylus tenuis]|uniref:Uncharacterized protein n=1 Tax=Parelaphostrongylus tenuis TaxID=148309 RepID=A0AAD5N6V8_PARTN|nr:hypothetical protein KIN20_023761 [Parelaphostrongylus tenuis]